MLSDIGIVQTDDPEYAWTLERHMDAQYQHSINNDYAAKHNMALSEEHSGNITHYTLERGTGGSSTEGEGENAHASSGDPQQTKPAPQLLSAKQQQKYNEARAKLLEKLTIGSKHYSKKLVAFLTKHGFEIDQVIRAVLDQQAYDGPGSNNITMGQAGLVCSGSTEAKILVSDYMSGFKGGKLKALTATFGANPNDVYFTGKGAGDTISILHEALHSLTGLQDIPLAARLGQGYHGDYRYASQAITDSLKKHW